MNKKAKGSRKYKLQWRFMQRVAAELLGSQKYSTSTAAIGELAANALDAGATLVEIEVKENVIGGIDSIVIRDNGSGMSPKELAARFIMVGIEPLVGRDRAPRFGRFGVGRLAVHRIGTLSKWDTVAQVNDGRALSTFTLFSDDRGGLEVTEEQVSTENPTGTSIEIFNLRDTARETLSVPRIANDLLAQFCSFLLGNRGRQIRVQEETLNVDQMVEKYEREIIPPSEHISSEATLTHLLLTRSVDRSRFPAQVLFSAKGRTVTTNQPEDVPSPFYLGLVECPYLDSIVTANREGLIEMDGGFTHLKNSVVTKIRAFGERLKAEKKRRFIETARKEDYYPFREPTRDPIAGVEQALYDVFLEKLNEHANLESLTKKQQAVVFRLLQRSLDNENLLEVLHQVANLSDEDMEKFRKVLERTTLESIIKLASEVTNRLGFLDILHQMVYGDLAKQLQERTQLHRIIEPQCWLFGSQFHLATSDKSFREIIRKHRLSAGLDDVPDGIIQGIKGIKDIPDLFLAASRDYPVEPKHHHVIVELKAPSVSLGRKEVQQLRRYAECILESHEFDKHSTRWDMFLVSAKANKEIERDRNQKDKPYGCLWEWENMTLWAFEWNEVIGRAREEMHLVRDHLKQKSTELTVSDYLRESFPEILESLKMDTAGPASPAAGNVASQTVPLAPEMPESSESASTS